MATTTLAGHSAAKFSGDYYWLLAETKENKAGIFTDPSEDQCDLPFHNRMHPDMTRKLFEKTLSWVQIGDRFIGYASTPKRVMALFEVTGIVPGDGIKFQRIKLLSAPVEWTALKTKRPGLDTHWPKSSVGQLHPIKNTVGETIWRFIDKQPGVAKPIDDSRVLPSPTDENENNFGTAHPKPNAVAATIETESDVGGTNGKPSDDEEPDAIDDFNAHESELNDIPDETERDEVRKSRIGQGKFRKDLIEQWSGVCAVTGLSKQSLLRASHIKPWRNSDNRERLDRFNGLLLAPHLDALFDGGLISFEDSGRIVLSKELSRDDSSLLGVNNDLKLPSIDERHKKYLRFHRENRLRPRPIN